MVQTETNFMHAILPNYLRFLSVLGFAESSVAFRPHFPAVPLPAYAVTLNHTVFSYKPSHFVPPNRAIRSETGLRSCTMIFEFVSVDNAGRSLQADKQLIRSRAARAKNKRADSRRSRRAAKRAALLQQNAVIHAPPHDLQLVPFAKRLGSDSQELLYKCTLRYILTGCIILSLNMPVISLKKLRAEKASAGA